MCFRWQKLLNTDRSNRKISGPGGGASGQIPRAPAWNGVLRRRWTNRKYDANRFKFSTREKTFPKIICNVDTRSQKLHSAFSLARADIRMARGIHCCPNFFYFFCPTSVSVLWRICVYIHISDCVETVHELPLLPSNNASETILHKSEAVRSVNWIFIIIVLAWWWLGECYLQNL